MKNIILLLLLAPLFGLSQTTHTVAAKETLYSVSRQYNISPKELAAFNNLTTDVGLNIGQVLKIPPKAGQQLAKVPAKNIVKAAPKKEEVATRLVPEYHKVQKKETLYQISKKYKNVTVADLKKWNKLTSDGVNEGADLIVGYKKEPVQVSKPTDTEMAKNKEVIEEVAEVKQPVIEEPKKEEKVSEPVKQPEVSKPVGAKEVIKDKPASGKNFNGGYFKSQFEGKASKEESGLASVFKTTSGWEDGKYYCLHNTATAGTIVKISNKANQKTIYAKVLDVIPDLKQNEGMLVIISNAAAEELGATPDNFEVTLNF